MISSGQDKYLLIPDKVFDGEVMHNGWVVLIEGNRIIKVGQRSTLSDLEGVTEIKMEGHTLIPGLIEGHAHILLYPYNQTTWNDQVLKESDAYRVAKATIHAKNTLMAGYTTLRDLGSEGAEYADVGIKKAINDGIIPGPRMLVAGPAIVATGSYGPKGFDPAHAMPLGAQEADGSELFKVVREQIGKGADFVKVYADYRWGIKEETMPTFTLSELQLIVDIATSSGRPVVAHASSPEAIRRAVEAGVETIEHGNYATMESFLLMKKKNVSYCPTLAASESIAQYKGWKKGEDPMPEGIIEKKKAFSNALKSGVSICAGGDVGVFEHGNNVLELELMVEYGMTDLEVLKSATSGNARIFHLNTELGHIKEGFLADIVAVKGDPTKGISVLRHVSWVMKDGIVYKNELGRKE